MDRYEREGDSKKAKKAPRAQLNKSTPENFAFIRGFGGSEGTRTPDPLHAMQVRYQLRHRPSFAEKATGTGYYSSRTDCASAGATMDP